jgi:hypothetical protein
MKLGVTLGLLDHAAWLETALETDRLGFDSGGRHEIR